MVYHGIIVELELYKTKRRRYVCKSVHIANFQDEARYFYSLRFFSAATALTSSPISS
jgi:hypothetical protein